MKRIFFSLLIFIILFISIPLFSQVKVKGYYRKNGTYVQSHYRSSPNSTKLDNYSTKGNINPYTGTEGTKNAYEGYSVGIDAKTLNADKPITELPKGEAIPNIEISNYDLGMTYFEKSGPEFTETFSLKNNTDTNINQIKIRLIYYDNNSNIIDYRDLLLKGPIPNGLAKKYTLRSFDQTQEFAYKFGNSLFKDSYKSFEVKFTILDIK